MPAEGLPAGLAAALAERGAALESSWRERARAYGRAGDLFVRWSRDPADVAVFAHEADVRERVGADGALRSPPVLAHGPGWLLERAIDAAPLAGRPAVEAVVAAAAELAGAALPPPPESVPDAGHRVAAARQSLRVLLRTPIGRDALAARRLLRGSELPLVTSHGDFHAGNLLVEGGVPWVIDWELLDRRPAGFDLMQLWPDLTASGDREALLEATVALVGERRRAAVLELRYVLLVRAIAAKLAPLRDVPDRERARALLELLPDVRAAARVTLRGSAR
jgi:hypothetical protein